MPKSWLPPEPDATNVDIRDWWKPEPVEAWRREASLSFDQLAYFVVDELHAGVAGLVASPWPVVDDNGRVLFSSEDESVRMTREADRLLDRLRTQRKAVVSGQVDGATERQLKARKLTIGDAFAVSVRRRRFQEEPPILDISAHAREVAKLQAGGTSAGVMDEEFLDAIARDYIGGPLGQPGYEDRLERADSVPDEARERPQAVPLEEVLASRAKVHRALLELAEERTGAEADASEGDGPAPAET